VFSENPHNQHNQHNQHQHGNHNQQQCEGMMFAGIFGLILKVLANLLQTMHAELAHITPGSTLAVPS
jgi:hypothetical protein